MVIKKYKEIWIYNETDEQALCALINGEYGWLMYLREEGDAGFSSRNPDYKGTEDATIEYFKKYHKPPKFVVWHNDSGDGVSLNHILSNRL
ncbi:hypothetical protein [uncultured Clostridium sp.]|uniref:hypothetical protein n=1 Tax=uncultured Clostridium sp. TaxID=59620 RepID=UPI0028EEE793|nr:hypothetical protein [uncultured Clostridium sp.]